jgi:hypothetical protein
MSVLDKKNVEGHRLQLANDPQEKNVPRQTQQTKALLQTHLKEKR